MSTREDLLRQMVQKIQNGEPLDPLFQIEAASKGIDLGVATPPKATMTQTGTFLGKALDLTQRLNYAKNAAIYTLLHGAGEQIKERDSKASLVNAASFPLRVPLAGIAAWKGLKGELPVQGKQIAEELGIPSTQIIPSLLRPLAERSETAQAVSDFAAKTPVLGSTWSGVTGMAFDVYTDPLAPAKLFGLTKAGQTAKIAGTAGATLAEQAAKGERSLLSYAGSSWQSIPGVGAAAKTIDTKTFEAIDKSWAYMRENPVVQVALEKLANMRISPKAKIEGALQDSAHIARYLSWRSKELNTSLDDEIRSLAKSAGVPEADLRNAILNEAQSLNPKGQVSVDTGKVLDIPDEFRSVHIPYGPTLQVKRPEDIQTARQTLIEAELGNMASELATSDWSPGGSFMDGYNVTGTYGAASTAPRWFIDDSANKEAVLKAIQAKNPNSPLYQRLQDIAKDRLSGRMERGEFRGDGMDDVWNALDIMELPEWEVDTQSQASPRAAKIAEMLRSSNNKMGATEVAMNIPTQLADESQTLYLHADVTDSVRAFFEKSKKANLPWYASFVKHYPAASLQHGAQKKRMIMPGLSLADANKAAMEGRTAWQAAEWGAYKIKSGDTLSQIAQRYKVSTQELAEKNGIKNPNAIQAGKEIRVPTDWEIVATQTPQAKPALPKEAVFKTDLADFQAGREAMHYKVTETATALDSIVEMGTTEGWASKTPPNSSWVEVSAPRFGDKLKGVYFRPDAAKTLNKWYTEWNGPEETNQVLSVVLSGARSVRDFWRGTTLYLFPEYHTRNAATGVIKNWQELDIKADPRTYAQGANFARARAGNKEALTSLKVTTATGKTYTGEQLIDLYNRYGVGQGWFKSFSDGSLSAEKTNLLNPMSIGRKAGELTEDTLRGTAFMEMLKRGHAPEQAAKMVKAVQFDYSNIPGWLRAARDTVFPFITWPYKNIPRATANLVTRPGKTSQIVSMIRAAETGQAGFENTDPKAVAQSQPWNYLPVYIGTNAKGEPQFASANPWALSDVGEITSDPVGTVTGMLAPWVKLPIETAMNKSMFTGRDIVNPDLLGVGQDKDLYAGLVPMDKRLLNMMTSWRPTSTVHNLGKSATTPGKSLSTEIRKLIFGVKPYSVDEWDVKQGQLEREQNALDIYDWRIKNYGMQGNWAQQELQQQQKDNLIQKLLGK